MPLEYNKDHLASTIKIGTTLEENQINPINSFFLESSFCSYLIFPKMPLFSQDTTKKIIDRLKRNAKLALSLVVSWLTINDLHCPLVVRQLTVRLTTSG